MRRVMSTIAPRASENVPGLRSRVKDWASFVGDEGQCCKRTSVSRYQETSGSSWTSLSNGSSCILLGKLLLTMLYRQVALLNASVAFPGPLFVTVELIYLGEDEDMDTDSLNDTNDVANPDNPDKESDLVSYNMSEINSLVGAFAAPQKAPFSVSFKCIPTESVAYLLSKGCPRVVSYDALISINLVFDYLLIEDQQLTRCFCKCTHCRSRYSATLNVSWSRGRLRDLRVTMN